METKNRNPIIAAILSLITPGLGQIYNGQLIKGIIVSIIFYALTLYFFYFEFFRTFTGAITALYIMWVLMIINIVEVVYTAKKQKDYVLKSYNKWYIYLLLFVIIGIIQTVVDDFGKIDSIYTTLRPYKIPSAAMTPTIMVGDHIVANMKYYDDHEPQKGDVIILEQPNKPSIYLIKRIIATEGDIIESKDKIIYLNGKPLAENYVQHTENENIPGNKDNRDNFGPFKIPPGSLFVMGDNRENSYDSRQFGNIDTDLIKGKVLYIFLSNNMNRVGLTVK